MFFPKLQKTFAFVLLTAVFFSQTGIVFAAPRTNPFTIGQTIDPGAEAVEPCGPTDGNCFTAVLSAQDEGTTISNNVLRFNFVGAGVSATSTAGVVTVNIAGGGLTALTDGKIYIGNASNLPTEQTLTGDATLSNTGVLTILNASSTARGFVSTSAQTFAGNKTFANTVTVSGATTLASLVLSGALTDGLSSIGSAGQILSSTGTSTKWISTSAATTNGVVSSANTLTSTVNGVASSTTIINTNVATSSTNFLTTIVNGITSSVANIINSFTQSLSGNVLTTTINGVAATSSVIGNNTLSSSGNVVTSNVNGVVSTSTAVNSNVLAFATSTGILSATVNGVLATTSIPASDTIYTADGTLSGNRAVTMGANTLAFVGSGANSFNVNAGTGGLTLTTATTGAVSITSGTTGAVTLDSGTTGNVNLGTGANAKTIAIGNNTGATTLNLTSGTGGINLAVAVAFKKGADFSTVGTTNDASLGNTSLVRMTGASAQTLSGIASGTDGKVLTLVNTTAFANSLTNNDAASVDGNKIITGTGATLPIPAGASVQLIYDDSGSAATSFWRVVGGSGGSSASTFTSGDITDKAAGGTIGTAAATVDIAANFNVNQTTTLQTLTIPSPTLATSTKGKIITVNNVGTANFTIGGVQVPAGSYGSAFVWTGTAWNPINAASNVSTSYITAFLGTAQTISGGSLVEHASFTTTGTQFGTDVTLDSTTAYTTTTNAASRGRFTLKAGKTYRLKGALSSRTTAAEVRGIQWFNSDTGTALPSSTTGSSVDPTVTSNSGYTTQPNAEAIFTPSVDTRVELRIAGGGYINNAATAITIASNASSGGDSGGRGDSYAIIEVVAGNTAVTGQSVDYVTVTSATTTFPALGTTPFPFDTVTGGNIPHAAGVFTLSAGKTYRLSASFVANDAFSNISYRWMNLTAGNTPIAGANGFGGTLSSTFSSGYADVVFTPTVTTQVYVSGTQGSPRTISAGSSVATIVQLGSTASTGVSFNSLTNAIAAGSLDNTNFAQSWNWSTATSTTGLAMSANVLTTGTLQSITSSSTALNSTNGLLYVANTSTSTLGLVFRAQSNAAAGSGLSVLANGTILVGTTTMSSAFTAGQTLLGIVGNVNNYLEANIQNRSTGNAAQSGYTATANNGTATTNFAWLGINGSGYATSSPVNVGGANDVNVLGFGNNMFVANASATGALAFLTGGVSTTTNTRMTITSTGLVGIGTSTPANTLHIGSASVSNTGGIRLPITNLTASAQQGGAIGVNANGDIVRIADVASQSTATGYSNPGSANNYTPNSGLNTIVNGTSTMPASTQTYAMFDGNYISPISLPPASGRTGGLSFYNSATFTATVVTTNTDLAASTNVSTGQSLHFVSDGFKWRNVATPQLGAASFSGLTSASVANTIDNTNFAQTWSWSTATTTNALALNANALTTGSALKLTTTATALVGTAGITGAGSLLDLNATGAATAFVGNLANIQNTGLTAAGNTGAALNINLLGTAQTMQALKITNASTGSLGITSTGGGVNFNFTGNHTGIGFNLNDATLSGTGMKINMSGGGSSKALEIGLPGHSSGQGIAITNNGAGLSTAGANTGSLIDARNNSLPTIFTGSLVNFALSDSTGNAGNTGTILNLFDGGVLNAGKLLNLTSSSTAATQNMLLTSASIANAASGLARFNFTGAHTGNGVQVDSSTVTGNAMAINSNGLTTGTGLNISSTGAYTGTNGIFNLTANSATTGTVGKINVNGLTTGIGLHISNSVTNANAKRLLVLQGGDDTAAETGSHIQFLRPDGTVIGTIAQNAATTIAYNTSSDARVKHDIVDTTKGLADLLNIHVKDFAYNADSSNKVVTGFIAQDLAKVFSDAVTTNGDDGLMPLADTNRMWQVDYGRMTPLLTKSIQDLNGLVFATTTASGTKAVSVINSIEDVRALVGTTTLMADGVPQENIILALQSLMSSTSSTSTLVSLTDTNGNVTEVMQDTFVGKVWNAMKERMVAWFEDASNGITKFFAKEVATEKLCVGTADSKTCITKTQLDALLQGQVNQGNGNSGNAGGNSGSGAPTCTLPQVLNTAGDTCVDPEVPPADSGSGDVGGNTGGDQNPPVPEVTPTPEPVTE